MNIASRLLGGTALTGLLMGLVVSPVMATSYTKTEFLTIMLNYAYSEDYTFSSSSYICGDTANNFNEGLINFDIDNLTVKGKTNETYLTLNGVVYLLSGTIKKNSSGVYKVNMTGEYASEQAGSTAEVTLSASLNKKNPYKIKKMTVRADSTGTGDFEGRDCVTKATIKNISADTSVVD